eukprot:8180014-Heterocapsa_arctica.AAC.1
MSCVLSAKHGVQSIFSKDGMCLQRGKQVIQLVEKDRLGFLSINYFDEKSTCDKFIGGWLTMPVVPAIDLVTEGVGVDDGMDELPKGDFVAEQEVDQHDIDSELYEDAELAEAAGSPAPEVDAATIAPPMWDHEEHELTHLSYNSRCRACLESRGKKTPHEEMDQERRRHVAQDGRPRGDDQGPLWR